MTRAIPLCTALVLSLVATVSSAQTKSVSPFPGALTRITTPPRNTLGVAVPAAVGLFHAEETEALPDFDIYTKDGIGIDHGHASPVIVLGYKNVRSDLHPWAIEAGYKYIDATGGHLDLYLLNASITPWSRRTSDGAGSDSLTIEADGSDVRSTERRLDTYGIFEVARAAAVLDVFAGYTNTREVTGSRSHDFTFAFSPTLVLSKHFSLNTFYSFRNDVDGEDYAEVSIARSFDKPKFQLAVVAAKHGTYAVRFQTTLRHFFRTRHS